MRANRRNIANCGSVDASTLPSEVDSVDGEVVDILKAVGGLDTHHRDQLASSPDHRWASEPAR